MRKAGCILLAALLTACTLTPDWEPGVSQTLAQARAERISGLSYALSFEIPDTLDAPCKGAVTLAFDLKGRGPLLLDFRPGAEPSMALPSTGKSWRRRCGMSTSSCLPGRSAAGPTK